jgi:hypothetical protein
MSPLHNGEAFNIANPGRKCGMLLGGRPFQRKKGLYFIALRRIFGLNRPGRYLRSISYLLVTKDAMPAVMVRILCCRRPKLRSAGAFRGPDDLP